MFKKKKYIVEYELYWDASNVHKTTLVTNDEWKALKIIKEKNKTDMVKIISIIEK